MYTVCDVKTNFVWKLVGAWSGQIRCHAALYECFYVKLCGENHITSCRRNGIPMQVEGGPNTVEPSDPHCYEARSNASIKMGQQGPSFNGCKKESDCT